MRPALLALVLLAACAARPLTETERAFTGTIMGPALDTGDVRIVKGAVVALIPKTIPPRPRTTCREKLNPPRSEPAKGVFPAFATGETVYYATRFWRADFLKGYPEGMELRHAMRLAHELTHVWQWQARAETGYHPLKASFEHIEKDDPYLLTLDPQKRFLDYAYEQQGVIVEEFVCCRALDPDGARTARLRALVGQVFPAPAATETVARSAIRLPHEGVETRGICS